MIAFLRFFRVWLKAQCVIWLQNLSWDISGCVRILIFAAIHPVPNNVHLYYSGKQLGQYIADYSWQWFGKLKNFSSCFVTSQWSKVGASRIKSELFQVCCPWISCKERYNVFNSSRDLTRPHVWRFA